MKNLTDAAGDRGGGQRNGSGLRSSGKSYQQLCDVVQHEAEQPSDVP